MVDDAVTPDRGGLGPRFAADVGRGAQTWPGRGGAAAPAARPWGAPTTGPGPAVVELLVRAGRELSAAHDAADPGERYRRAHLGALRVAASVLALRRAASPRARPRPVWELLEREAPDLRDWAAYFSAGAALRAAVEAGRAGGVPAETADDQLAMAERFLDLVVGLCSAAPPPDGRAPAWAASLAATG